MKMRIGTKLMLGAVVGVLAVVSAVSFAAYRIARDGLEKQISAHLESVAQSRAAHVRTFVREHREMIRIAATSRVLRAGLRSLEAGDADRASVVRDLNTRLRHYNDPDGDVYEMFLLDRHGRVIASTSSENMGLDRSTDAYFVGAQGGPFVKDAYHSKTAGQPSLALSAPLADQASGELLGVLVARLGLDGLNKIVTDRTGMGKTGETYLINKYGFTITPSRFLKDTFLEQKVDTENARGCLADTAAMRAGRLAEGHEHVTLVYEDYRGVRALGVHDHIPEMGWGLLAAIDASEAFAPIARLRTAILFFAALFAAAALAMAYFLARRISMPIRELHVGSERIGSGDLGHRVHISTGDEIEQLADEFNRMAEKLSESYASLEQQVAERTAHLEGEIAEREQAEQALRQSERKYRALLENLPQNIFSKDRNCVYVSCNQNFARELGITAGEFAGHTDHDFFPKELADKYRADDRRVMGTGETLVIEERYTRKGQETIVHTVKTPIRDEQGNVIGVLGIFWDIAERKRAEEELRQTLAELERFNRLAIGRELRMIELKREVNEMASKAGIPPPYDLAFAEAST